MFCPMRKTVIQDENKLSVVPEKDVTTKFVPKIQEFITIRPRFIIIVVS